MDDQESNIVNLFEKNIALKTKQECKVDRRWFTNTIQILIFILLYPPHRGYISFVNTFVTHRNNDLGPYVP